MYFKISNFAPVFRCSYECKLNLNVRWLVDEKRAYTKHEVF